MKENSGVSAVNQTNLNYYQNNLNLIRLLAALQVLYGHLSVHLQLKSLSFIKNFLSLFYGVPVFFFMSGYLIWRSIDRTKNIKEYFLKRVLRLYPELWCGVIISIISIFILYDNVILKDIILFTITQGTFMQFWTPDSLRGFGCGTPNGSLWTICVILQFYIVAWFIKKIVNKYKSDMFNISFLIISVFISLLVPLTKSFLPLIAYKLFQQTLIPYLWLFLLGVFACEYFDLIVPVLKKFWYIPAILFYCFSNVDIHASYPIIKSILSCCFCLGAAYTFTSPKFIKIKYDISYGIYIYHMIIVNISLELGFKGNWFVGATVILITLIMATASSFTVGKFGKKKRQKYKTNI